MEKFNNIKSIPAYLPIMNIDTDKIIPKQFLKTIKRSGLGKSLFYEMRFDEKGKPIKGFILDNDPYKNSKILLGILSDNFSCLEYSQSKFIGQRMNIGDQSPTKP